MFSVLVRVGVVGATAVGAAVVGAVVTTQCPAVREAVQSTCDTLANGATAAWGRVTGLFGAKQEQPCVVVVLSPDGVPVTPTK